MISQLYFLKLIIINHFMNNNRKSMKSADKMSSLAQLSISQIWENKFFDESSDFQQQHQFIKTIKQKKELQHQYGLKFNKKVPCKPKLQINEAPNVKTHDDTSIFRSTTQAFNMFDKDYVLSFNKQKKRKRSVSKQKKLNQFSSAKNLFSTKPVPHIQQHTFKPNKQSKTRLSNNLQLRASKAIVMKLDKSKANVRTTLYQIPLSHKKYRNDSVYYRATYHLMTDQIKIQINDFNCAIIDEPVRVKTQSMSHKSILTQEPDTTVKNYWEQRNCAPDKSNLSSQLTYFNQLHDYTSCMVENVCEPNIVERKRPRSFNNRNSSKFSSSKTDRYAESSPYQKESIRTKTRTENKQKFQDLYQQKIDMNHEKPTDQFYRKPSSSQNQQKYGFQYFVKGYTQQNPKKSTFP